MVAQPRVRVAWTRLALVGWGAALVLAWAAYQDCDLRGTRADVLILGGAAASAASLALAVWSTLRKEPLLAVGAAAAVCLAYLGVLALAASSSVGDCH